MEYWYPITGTYVLSTGIFYDYGGDDLGATTAQLNAAFCMAEQLVEMELESFIEPKSWTGTFDRVAYGQPMMLPHAHLRSIDSVVLRCETNSCTCATRDITSCAHIKERPSSIIELRYGRNTSCSCSGCGRPLSFQIAYTAGIPTNSLSSAPAALMALTKVAQEMVEQIMDPGASEGGEGAPGIEEWSQFKYRERRFGLIRTQLGNSPRANFAVKMLKPWKVKRSFKLGY